MPSFDIVSEVNNHEIINAVDQANKEVTTRFDFKGTNSSYALEKETVTLVSQGEAQLKIMLDILRVKLSKRGIDLKCMDTEQPQSSGKESRQVVTIRRGIDTPLAKKIVKLIKDQKMKVQASIMDEKVRVSGKKRDDLQTVIELMKESKLEMPLQFENFRD